MALVDLVKGKDVPRPDKGAQGNIPNDSPEFNLQANFFNNRLYLRW